eukprot:3511219-Prorocentrum_lima.AAC.1
MTQYGEIMTGQTQNGSDVGWICPVSRLVNELGMKRTWGNDQLSLKDSSGEESVVQKHYGLPLVDWDDF